MSYSMLLTNKNIKISNENKKQLNNQFNNPFNNNPFNNIDDKKIYKWIDDSIITRCHNCDIQFGIFYRKHHCRLCGRIFCYNCSNYFENVPKELQVTNEYNMENIIEKNVRLCKCCYNKMIEIKYLKQLIDIFELIDLDIIDLLVLRSVCKTWRRSSNFILSKIREIQYFLPDHNYNNFEKKVLWNNRKYFIGHSQWFMKLLKSIDYDDYQSSKTKLSIIIELMKHTEKTVSCKKLMCTRYCTSSISAEDSLCLLDKTINSKIIKKFIIVYLDLASIEELTNYLPFLIHYMKYETIEDSIIGNYLINKCIFFSYPCNNKIDNNKLYFINEVYWLLLLGLEDKEYYIRYKFFIDRFNDEIHKMILNLIKSGHNFVNLFTPILNIMDEYEIKNIIRKQIQKINCLSIPLNPIINNIEININEIHRKKSATKPLFIPIKNNNNNYFIDNYNVLYKNEDIRKDKIIINIIKLIDIIIKKEEKLDLGILTYNVCCINSKSGLIEIVPNCDTIYNIKEKKKFSILNYIIENNKNDKIEDIRKRFTKSCAAYCVITYLLGIGDRHLENIMITDNGILFHIDYSFILGYDAKNINPKMRITTDMVDALGGINSENYKEFKILCNRIFNCLRKHINLFINLLTLIPEMSPEIENYQPFTKEKIKNEILNRLMPGENDKYTELVLYNFIDNSSNDYKQMINDVLHYYSTENVIINNAKNLFSNVYNTIFEK